MAPETEEHPKIVEHVLATGEPFEMRVGGYHVRVMINMQSDGRVHWKAVTLQGELKNLSATDEVKSEEESPASREQEKAA